MRYDVGRFRRPMRRSTEGQLMSLISLGDGSTLTLDFTTGVLDPRLTFTRTSNATFINSSGLVEWAAANMFINSVWTDANNTPTGWTLGTSTGTISRSGETRTFTCAAQQYWFYQQPATKNGLTYTLSFEITALSGTFTLGDVLLAGSSTSSPSPLGWYKDGAFLAGGGATQATTGRFALVFTANADNTICRIGLGTAGVNVTGSVTIRYTQIQPGIYPSRAYLENTSTSAANHNTPRFDYDSTTLAPRGLLIEGTATNLLSYSEDFSNGVWSKANTNSAMPLTGTAPDGSSTSRLLEENTTSYAKHSLERLSAITITANNVYTLSVWLKEPTSNSRRYAHIQLADGQATAARYTIVADLQTGTISASGANNGTAGAPTGTAHSITAYPGGWYRVTLSMNHVASPSYPTVVLGDSASLFGGNNQPFYSATTPYKGLLIWGAQLEAGSGASSYIPTGASTVQRLADECQLLDLTTMGFNASAGTIYVDMGARISTGSNRSYTFLPASGGNNQIFEGSGVAFQVFSGGSFVAQIGTSTIAAQKIASAYAVNDYAVSVNGGAVATDTSGALPTSLTKLTLGGSIINTAAYQFGCIRTFKYWPTRLPNAQLQSLST